MDNGIQELVSVIIPTYNCEQYIKQTINSLQNQTYRNWEAIFVDDASTDQTEKKIKQMSQNDSRIMYVKLEKNSGAAIARNLGIGIAKGKYLAFLDSDDVWRKNKLEKQINFMELNNYDFTCTYYGKIDELGKDLDIITKYKAEADYEYLLRECPGNSTVIYNVVKLGKHYIPNIKKRNDYVMWLQVIKSSQNLYCLNEVLSNHRLRKGSLSASKSSLIKYHWYVYRNIEHLTLLKTIFLLCFWIKKSIYKKMR